MDRNLISTVMSMMTLIIEEQTGAVSAIGSQS